MSWREGAEPRFLKETKPATYEILGADVERTVQCSVDHSWRAQTTRLKDLEAVGLLVDKLSRTQFGNLDVSGLRPGRIPPAGTKEISQLHNLAVTKSKKHENNLIALVRGYQKWISPLFPPSVASTDLFQLYDRYLNVLVKGVLMGIVLILRRHPEPK